MGLFTVMALTRLLSKEDFGLYQQTWLVYNTALPLVMVGLPAGITFFVPQANRIEQKMIIVQTALLLAIVGSLMGLGIFVFADVIGEVFSGKQLPALLRSFAIFPVFALPLVVMDVFLVATRRSPEAAILSVLSALMQFVAVTVPAALGYGLTTVIHVLCVTAVIRLILFAPIIMRGYGALGYVWDAGFYRRLLRYTVPLGLATVMSVLVLQTGKLLIAARFPPEEYALYIVAAREMPFVASMTGAVMAVVTPEFVRLYRASCHKEIVALWQAATRKTAVFLIPLTVFLAVFARDVIITLFTAKFEASTHIFLIYLLLLPLRITQYGSLLMAAGRSFHILWAHTVAVPVSLILGLLLIPVLGVAGAAVATVAAVYLVSGWLLVACARLIERPVSSILPWDFLWKIAVASVIVGGGASTVKLWLEPGPTSLFVGLTAFVALAVPTGCLISTLREEVHQLLRAVLPSRV